MRKREFFLLGIFLLTTLTLVSGYDCKVEGCPPDFRCMANGECTPLLVKEYCEDHGKPFYIYDNSLLERNCTDILNLKEEKLCMQCQADYELNKTVGDIERIIFGIAAGIAVLILSINGIRLMTSRDPREREGAKKAIVYVILGLVFIVVSTKLVEYLLV